jgi:coenzyme F420-reducing hydrogenase delta subunit/Pyruvate/2-oxoacid:ferredoxin oxidoreductase delta subunit/thioredoxin reductase
MHADRAAATSRALEIVAAGVRRLGRSVPIAAETVPASTDVAVLGGGIAALQAAASLANLGHRVFLVHDGPSLGGRAAGFPDLYAYLDPDPETARGLAADGVRRLVERARGDDRISAVPEAVLESVDGELGGFRLALRARGERRTLEAGALVLAVGARPAAGLPGVPPGTPLVVDFCGLAERLARKDAPRRVAILLDVAGEQGRAQTGLALSASELLARKWKAEVRLYCGSVRVAAPGLEELYRRARAAGVVVVKLDAAPALAVAEGRITVRAADPVAEVVATEAFDLAVVADAEPCTAGLDRLVALRPGPHGSLQADNVWLLPAETNRPGVLVVGEARGDAELRASRTDAAAAALRIHELLAGGRIAVARDAAEVAAEKCVRCLTCLRLCPHGAIRFDERRRAAAVSVLSCRRCGACAAECPARAIGLPGWTDEQLEAEAEGGGVVAFACENSAWPAATAAGRARLACGTEVRLVRVPCAGRVDMRQVLGALEGGAARVVVLGCHPESCRYLTGSTRAARRLERMRALLKQAGFDPGRLAFGGLAPVEPWALAGHLRGAAAGGGR